MRVAVINSNAALKLTAMMWSMGLKPSDLFPEEIEVYEITDEDLEDFLD